MQKYTKNIYIYLFLIVFVISAYLKIAPVLNYNFPFTTDQGRDMLDIRTIAVGHHLSLIGPTTSINGVFLGPFYYYFNVIPFLMGGGDPSYLVYWNIGLYLLAGALLWVYFRKQNPLFALISSTIFLMAPSLFYSSRFFWSANPMAPFTVFYFLSLFYYLDKKTWKSALFLGVLSGLCFQIEAAFGVLLFPFALITFLATRQSTKNGSLLILGYLVTLLPQVLFELKHGFVMTNTFIREASGSSQILGDKLNYAETFQSHFDTFLQFSNGLFEIKDSISIFITGISLAFLIYLIISKKISPKIKNYFLLSVLFVIFGFLFYMGYKHQLKGWYVLGLRVPFLFIISAFLTEVIVYFQKMKVFKKTFLPSIVVFGFLIFVFSNSAIVQNRFVPKPTDRSTDKSNFRNEVEDIDMIYKDAAGQSFKAYNYMASVYDFPYQYIYWWYGTKTYGYQPAVLTYFVNPIPEYIKDNEKYFTQRKALTPDSSVYLIMEKDEMESRLLAWRGQFTNLCSVSVKKLQWDTTIEKMQNCPTKTN